MRGSVAFLAALAVAAALAASDPAAAVPQRYAVDTASSVVDFRIRYLGLFTPGGRFGRVTGVVVFDPAHWETLEVTIQIPVDSLESRPEFWRGELLGPRFFDNARYPLIEFRVARATRTTPDAGETTGSLALHGVTRPVTLRARITPTVGALEVEAETRLSRAAFGLAATLPLASDEVKVILRIRAVLASAP